MRRAQFLAYLLWLVGIPASMPLCAAEVSLTTDTTLSTEGYFVLNWETIDPSSQPVILQQSDSEDFSVDREFTLPSNGSITITGLDNGHYYFRAYQEGSPFSNTVAIEVVHHSLQRALFFFSIGLVLFLILVVTIVMGNRSLVKPTQVKPTDVKPNDGEPTDAS